MFSPAEIRRNVCAELEQLDRLHLRQLQEILLRQTHEQQSLQRRLFLKYYDNLEERPLIGLESMIMEFPRQLVLMTCYERIEEDFEKKVMQLKADLDGELKRLRDELAVKREKMLEDQQHEMADLRQKLSDELQQLSAAAQGQDEEKTEDLAEEHQQQIVTMQHKHNEENRELMASLLGKEFYLRKTFEVNVRSLKARLDKNLGAMPRMEPVVLLEPQRYLKLRREAREQRRMLQQKGVKKSPKEETKEVKEVAGGSQEVDKALRPDENEGHKKKCVKDQDEVENNKESNHKIEEETKATEDQNQDEKAEEHPNSPPPTEAPLEADDAGLEDDTERTEESPKTKMDLSKSPTPEVPTSKGSNKNPVNFQESGPKSTATRPEEAKPMAMQNVAFFGLGPRRLPAMPALGPFQPPSPTPIVYPAHYQPGYYYPPMVGFNGQTGGAGSYRHPYVHAKNPFTVSHPQGVEPSVRMGDHSGHGPQQLNQPGWPHQLSYPQQTTTMWPPNSAANASYGPMGSMQPNAVLLAATSPQHTQFPITANFNTTRPSPHYEHATNWFIRQPTHCGPPHTLHARPNCSQSAPCLNPSSGQAASPQPSNYPKYNTGLKQVAQVVKTPNKQFFPRRQPKKQRVSPKDLITLSPPPHKEPVNQHAESTPEKRITILTNPNRSSNSRSSKREHEKKKLLDSFHDKNDEGSDIHEKEEGSLQNIVEGNAAEPSGGSQNRNEIVVGNKQKEELEDNKEPSQVPL